MTERKFNTRDSERELIRLYRKGMSMQALADYYGTSVRTVRNTLLRLEEPRRRAGAVEQPVTKAEIREMVRRYRRGESQEAIATAMHRHQSRVSRVLRSHGLAGEIRARSDHPNWRGGRVNIGAYVQVYVGIDHPMANSQGYVLEHRLVMAEHLGRPLTRTETVHHKDGNTTNNVISNLELRRGPHGKGVRFRCADCGSINIEPW